MTLEIDALKKDKKWKFLIEEKNGWYTYKIFTKNWEKILKVSDFTLTVKDIIQVLSEEDVERRLVVEINHNGQKDVWTFEPKDICDIGSFKKAIRSRNPSCWFFDLDNKSLEELIRYIQPTDISYTTEVSQFWFIKDYNCFTFNDGVIYKQKFYPYNDLRVADLWDLKIKIRERSKYLPKYINDNEYTPDIKYKLSDHMNHMFWGIQWNLVIWFMISSLFINSCKKQLKPFPILFASWKRASWKTIALSHAMEMLWLENVAGAAEQDNEFVDSFNMNKISSLPYWSDEYKNQKKTQEKQSFYKTIFDRNWVSKGNIWDKKNPSLWVNTMDVHASLILSWEQTPSDDAVFSRVCLIDISDKRSGDLYSEIKQDSFAYPSLIRDILTNNDFEELTKKFIVKLIRAEKILKTQWLEKRILNVYNPIIAWYMLFVEEILWKEIHSSFFNNVAKHAEEKKQENENDIVEEFFEKVNFKLSKWYNDASEHIRYNALNKTVNFNFTYLYWLYSEHEYNAVPKSNLKKYIKAKYNPKDSSMSKTGNKSKWSYWHTMLFDIDNMPYALQEHIDDFDNDNN